MFKTADARVGSLVLELLSAVKDVIHKNEALRPTLEKLQSTLESVGPDVEKIEELEKKLKWSQEKTKRIKGIMKKGRKNVLGCSDKPNWRKVLFKGNFKEILTDLDKDICSYFQIEGKDEDVRNKNIVMNGCTAPAPPQFTVGFDGHLKELKRKLLWEEDSVSMTTVTGGAGKTTSAEAKVRVTSVTGLRGTGKTTLAQMFCWDDKVKGVFKDNIFFVAFGKSPKLKTIVRNLFQHSGRPVPGFQNDEDAKNQLEILLKDLRRKSPILLVLDDVYPGSESLVDKFSFNIPNYKILVTSRSSILRFGGPAQVERMIPLGEKDGIELLRHSASLNQKNSVIPDDDVVKKIVEACRGSPLALTVSGSSLRDKNLDCWVKRAEDLSSKGLKIIDYDKHILTCLQESFDGLDPKAMERFRNLGLFPEDQMIPAAALMDMWHGLHNEENIIAFAKLHNLVDLNMADMIVTRKGASKLDDYNYHYVTQHSLLRDLAIHQTSQEPEENRATLIIEIKGNNLPEWWSVEKEYPIAARILSISTDKEFSSEWCNNLQPSKVEALVLNLRGKKCTLPMFMKKMNELKVLSITNYDFYHAELENFELLDHLDNLKQLRLEKMSIPFLSNTKLQMKNLHKCSFFMCNVNAASENCTTQISDMMPNLVEMDFDYCTMVELPVVLSNMVSLTNLKITNCHNLSALPEEIGKLVKLETLMLSSCTQLSELPESITSLLNLQFLDISDCVSLNKLPEDIGKLSKLEMLNVKGCSRLLEVPTSIVSLMNLTDVICDEDFVEIWEYSKIFLEDLIEVKVVQADFTLDFLRNSH